jgi:NAD(P)-dependent dehydrogenase (short-subunit alcohol dehydrogenase family)
MGKNGAMQNFEGRVAVITGGASGIGLAIAKRCIAEGMSVAIGDVEKTALDDSVELLRSLVPGDDGAEAPNRRVFGFALDVCDGAQMQAFADAAVEHFGGVNIFFNNAGVGGGGLSWETPIETWEWTLGVNLWGVIHGVRSFVPLLLLQQDAHIVNTASVAGLVASPMMGAYNASKHAVVAISETLHHEFALLGATPKVSVLCPGWVNTGIGDSERNRPDHLMVASEADEAAEAAAAPMRDVLRGVLANGMDPSDVAAKVFQAIRTEQFWIQTHAEADGDKWMNAVNSRLDSAKHRTNPVLSMVI